MLWYKYIVAANRRGFCGRLITCAAYHKHPLPVVSIPQRCSPIVAFHIHVSFQIPQHPCWNNNIADPWMSFSCRSSRNLVLDNRRKVTALNYFQYWSPSPPFHPILLLNPETKCCISRGPFFTWSRVFTNDEKTTTKCFILVSNFHWHVEVLLYTLRYFGVLQSILGYFWDIQVPLVTFKCFYFPDTFTLQQSLWLIFQLIQISLQYLPSFVSL